MKPSYFQYTYHYRSTHYVAYAAMFGFASLAFAGISIAYVALLTLGIREFSLAGAILIGGMMGLLSVVFMQVTSRMLGRIRRNECLDVVVDADGVRIGSDEYRWEHIVWVGAKRAAPWGDSVYLVFCYLEEGTVPFWVPTDKGLSSPRYEELVDKLHRHCAVHPVPLTLTKRVWFLRW